ncbi:hypothetical protein DYQ86_22835 [Acidobacteria bacterium AB60]|nr:hypothetical protein DYQ86_22835 [Acidobacteria bacterium AB60]
MIWHIFKKDWKLLWGFVLAVAFLHMMGALVQFKLGLFGEEPMLEMLSRWVPELAIFASAFLIAAIVHLDAVPGSRQDWLTRPIPRGGLLMEKLLFAIVMVEGPIFAASLGLSLANGFSWRASLLSTTAWSTFLLFFLVAPILAFASVTKNMAEAFIYGCGGAFVIGSFLILVGSWNALMHGTLLGATHTGLGWVAEVLRLALTAITAGIVLRLQYLRRKTAVARLLLVGLGVVLLVSALVPWKPVFALESKLSANAGAGAKTRMSFDPSEGRFQSPSGVAAPGESDRLRYGRNTADVFLPLRITGVPNDGILMVDQADVHFANESGREVYHGLGESFEVAREGPQPPEEPVYQRIELPMATMRRAQDQPLGVRVEYSLTQFRLSKSYALPAVDGEERMPGWGWCKTKVNDAGTDVELRCMEPGKGPICGTAFLENASSGARNPARSFCLSEYRPFQDHPWPDDLTHLGVNLPFRDATGLAKYPIEGAQLRSSQVVIRVYEPEDHFTRTLTIPAVRLREWEAE